MTDSVHPRSIPRSFDPARVRQPSDLPPYLVLGSIDEHSFERLGAGWSARWVGRDRATWFSVTWRPEDGHYTIRQANSGIEGPWGEFSANLPFDSVIGQVLCSRVRAVRHAS